MAFLDKIFSLGKKKFDTLEKDINNSYSLQNAELEFKNAKILLAKKIEKLIYTRSNIKFLNKKITEESQHILKYKDKIKEFLLNSEEDSAKEFAQKLLARQKKLDNFKNNLESKEKRSKYLKNLIEKSKLELEEAEYKLKEWRTNSKSKNTLDNLELFGELFPSTGYFVSLSEEIIEDEQEKISVLNEFNSPKYSSTDLEELLDNIRKEI